MLSRSSATVGLLPVDLDLVPRGDLLDLLTAEGRRVRDRPTGAVRLRLDQPGEPVSPGTGAQRVPAAGETGSVSRHGRPPAARGRRACPGASRPGRVGRGPR